MQADDKITCMQMLRSPNNASEVCVMKRRKNLVNMLFLQIASRILELGPTERIGRMVLTSTKFE